MTKAQNYMSNLPSIKNWLQYFLIPVCILVFSSTIVLSENVPPEAEAICESDCNIPNPRAELLNTAISQYQDIYAKGGWEHFPVGKNIRINNKDSRVPIARRILTVMGDYKIETDVEAEIDPEILDEHFAEAVKIFQERHGLEIDGAIGRKTQEALAVPVEFRIAQMKATLQRMQEMPALSKRYVLVNIAGFNLEAVDNNSTVINSRIIVGQPRHATPLFHRDIFEVSFNPQWHVPASIARNEMMGKLRDEPEYFTKGNYVIRDRDGEVINAEEIDWENQSDETYKFVQRAGSGNALGKIKFNLPDTNNIYLHSTGSPKLFAKAYRALSHGCIRVEKARELAHFVMGGMEGWNIERIDKLYDSSQSKIISVDPVEVYLVYWTSWVDSGTKQPYFYADVYGRDKKKVAEILESMKNPEEVSIAKETE